jgi:hypothetical protein
VKKKPDQQQYHRQIYRIRVTPAASVGLAHAPDADTAIQRVIEDAAASN